MTLLWSRKWTSGVHDRLGASWLTGQLLALQELSHVTLCKLEWIYQIHLVTSHFIVMLIMCTIHEMFLWCHIYGGKDGRNVENTWERWNFCTKVSVGKLEGRKLFFSEPRYRWWSYESSPEASVVDSSGCGQGIQRCSFMGVAVENWVL
jgi:hypothetical protein